MPMPSPCPWRWKRACGGLVALALVIGMRFPAVPQVPDPTGKAEQTADPLLNLNNASRMFYTLAKQQTLAKSGPVMIVVGDDLVLRKGEKRTQARVIPEIYHTLKTFDHIPLALDVALSAHAGETPLGEDFLNELRDYRGLFPAAGERIDRVGLDAEQRARQKTIIAACAQFVDSVLDKRQCLPAERMAFTRKMTPLLMANASAAARAALDSLHHQVCEWKGQLTPQDWSDLTVLVIGRQLPRKDNLAVQYFARLLGQSGESKRLIYAEGLGDEPRALDLLATHLVDTQIGIDFFNDPNRMARDLLSDGTRDYLPLLLPVARSQPPAPAPAPPGRQKPPVTVQSADPSGTQKTRLLDMIDSGQAEERTSFQTGARWDPMLQLPADVAMCYGVGPDLGPRIKLWKDKGYIVHAMTGVAWGNYQDYLYERFDGKRHVDEAQTDCRGNVISHGGDVFYMCPGPAFGNYLAQRVRAAIDAGASSIHLEEPEFWARAGYSEGFKRAWRTAYGESWTPPHSSPDGQYRASRLKYDLYRDALKQVFDAVRDHNARTGLRSRCYVATHSLINYAHWRIVSPESSLLSVGADGFIAQVWTGTARTPNVYEGVLRERTFETAFLEYGAMVAATRGSPGRLWFLHDPVEDAPDHSWEDYRTNWERTVVASLLWPETARYEVAPWPERLFHGTYPTVDRTHRKPGEPVHREPIPASYATELLTVMNALNDMDQAGISWGECGTRGIGIVVSDTMMFQRADPSPSDPHLGSFYGLALPLLERGMPVEPVQLETAMIPGNLARCKVLVMTYEGMKPMDRAANQAIADWVKMGGSLVFVDDDRDPYNAVKSWWNRAGTQSFRTPRESLFALLGLPRGAGPGSYAVGKGTLVFEASSPAALSYRQDGAEQVRQLLRKACAAAKLEYRETNHIVLRRGPYVIGVSLEGPPSDGTHELRGRFIDLFAPQRPIVSSVKLTAGRLCLLYDVDRALDLFPRVLASTCRTLDLTRTNEGFLRFRAHGPEGSEALLRIGLRAAPRKVLLDAKPLADDSWAWDDASHLVLLRFPNKAAGRLIVIE